MERRNFLKTGLAAGAIHHVMSMTSDGEAKAAETAAVKAPPTGTWIQILPTTSATPKPCDQDPHPCVRRAAIRLLKQTHTKYLGLSDELGEGDLPTDQGGLKYRLDAKFDQTEVNKLEMFGYFKASDYTESSLVMLIAIRWMKYVSGNKRIPRLKMIALNPKYFRSDSSANLKWAAARIDEKLKAAAPGKVVKLVVLPDLHSKHLRQLIKHARAQFNDDSNDRLTEIQRPDGSSLWKIEIP